MANPTFRVRIAWASDPFDPAPTWTDVSSFVKVKDDGQIDVSRGSGDLDDQVNAGTFAMVVNNKDGRFTVGYTAGAYYPNVVIGKRIQVHETTNGVLFNPRFDGFLDTLPQTWGPAALTALPTITAVDRLKKLGKQVASTDPIGLYIYLNATNQSLTDYFTLGDAEGTTSPANSGLIYDTPGVNLSLGGLRISSGSSAGSGVTFGSATGPGTDGLSAAESVNSSFQVTHPQVLGVDFTAMGFFRIVVLDPTSGIPSLFSYADVSGNSSQVGAATVDNTGVVHASLTASAGTTTLTGPNINDGATHHVAVVIDSRNPTSNVTTLSLYVDGLLVDTNTLSPTAASPAYQVTEWMRTWPITANGVGDLVGAHLAVFSSVASSSILNIALAGLTGFAGESSSARFSRIAGLAGITPTITGTSATQTMGALTGTSGRSYLDLLQEVQDTENGAFFARTDGDLEFVARSTFYNQAAALTLTSGQYGSDLTFLADDSRLINDVTVTDATGLVQRIQNTTSITANGTYSVQKTLSTLDSNEALSWAQWQINQVSTTSARVSQVTVDLLTQPSLIASVVAVEIGDRIDLTNLPTGAPASTVSLQVAGYTESYSVDHWTITFNTVPFLTGNVFTFNDATLGRFNTGGVFAY